MKKKTKKIVYYSDEGNDDFFDMNRNNLKQVDVNANYVYLPDSILFKIFHLFLLYYCNSNFISCKPLFFRARIKGRKNLKT